MKRTFLHVRLLITLNAMTAIPKLVPHWHVPGYEAKFGGDIEITGTELIERELNLQEEAAQLAASLGVNAETGQPYFDMAYGSGSVALRNLKQLIESNPTEAKLARDDEIALVDAIELEDDAPGSGDDGAAVGSGDPFAEPAAAKGAKPAKPKG